MKTFNLIGDHKDWIRKQFKLRELISEMLDIIDYANVGNAITDEEADQMKKMLGTIDQSFYDIVRFIDQSNPWLVKEEIMRSWETPKQTTFESLDQYEQTEQDKKIEELSEKIKLAMKILGSVYED